jgi:hypothetical protein
MTRVFAVIFCFSLNDGDGVDSRGADSREVTPRKRKQNERK